MTHADLYQKWRPSFEALLDTRYHGISWLDWMVGEGRALLCANEQAAAVAEIRCFPAGARDAHVLCAAGDLNVLKAEIIDKIISWAYDNGCISVTVESRAGWARALSPKGFEIHQVAVRKDL